jgi:urease accessory protein
VINKADLAPYVGADLGVMERDSRALRGDRPHVLTNCRLSHGVEKVVAHIEAARENITSPAWANVTHDHRH